MPRSVASLLALIRGILESDYRSDVHKGYDSPRDSKDGTDNPTDSKEDRSNKPSDTVKKFDLPTLF
jgi:hypothetical protein